MNTFKKSFILIRSVSCLVVVVVVVVVVVIVRRSIFVGVRMGFWVLLLFHAALSQNITITEEEEEEEEE